MSRTKNIRTIKAVCFDLDGVYFTSSSFQRFKKAISNGMDENIVNHVFHQSKEMLSFKMGETTENEYWNFVRKELGISYSNEEIYNLLQNSYETNTQIVEIVRLVKARGYMTCICSNNFETRIRELNKKFDFLGDFDIHVFSYKVGVLKPNKRIFETLIQKTNIEPNQIVYSDNSPEKMSEANELGIHTFVFEDVQGFTKKLEGFGVV